MSNNSNSNTELNDDSPPILSTWNQLYVLVVVLHFVVIGLFYWLTQSYI